MIFFHIMNKGQMGCEVISSPDLTAEMLFNVTQPYGDIIVPVVERAYLSRGAYTEANNPALSHWIIGFNPAFTPDQCCLALQNAFSLPLVQVAHR